MEGLVIVGTILCLIGIAILIWAILQVLRARRAGLDGDALRQRLQRLTVWNLGALMLSALGLMMIVTGMMLA